VQETSGNFTEPGEWFILLFTLPSVCVDTADVTGNGTDTRWKVLGESTSPRESVFVANTWQHLPHLNVLFCGPLVPNFPTEYFVNNRRFTEFVDRYLHSLY